MPRKRPPNEIKIGKNGKEIRICHAKSKRSGKKCQKAVVEPYPVCYMHGAGGGGQKGNQNRLVHGGYSNIYKEALTDKENELWDHIKLDPKDSLQESLRLTTIRELRVLNSIKRLKEKLETAHLARESEIQAQILAAENALTRVQGQKSTIVSKLVQLDAFKDLTDGGSEILNAYLASLQNMASTSDSDDEQED